VGWPDEPLGDHGKPLVVDLESVSTMPKVSRPETFLPGPSPGRRRGRRCSPDAAGIDDPCRGLRVAAFCLANEASQAIAGPLGGAVARPAQVVAVHGVPVRVALRECAPLTGRSRHGEDRVDDVTLVVHGWPTRSSISGVREPDRRSALTPRRCSRCAVRHRVPQGSDSVQASTVSPCRKSLDPAVAPDEETLPTTRSQPREQLADRRDPLRRRNRPIDPRRPPFYEPPGDNPMVA